MYSPTRDSRVAWGPVGEQEQDAHFAGKGSPRRERAGGWLGFAACKPEPVLRTPSQACVAKSKGCLWESGGFPETGSDRVRGSELGRAIGSAQQEAGAGAPEGHFRVRTLSAQGQVFACVPMGVQALLCGYARAREHRLKLR